MSSQCDVGVDLVRWEEGGEAEDGDPTVAAVAVAATEVEAEAEGVKTEKWVVMPEKVPPDVLPEPTREPLPP